MSNKNINWAGIEANPKFQTLYRKKTVFLWSLMIFSIIYYFMLPIGAAYYQDLFKTKVWGVINIGILFALSEFIVAWVLAFVYSKKANTQFDKMTQEIINDLKTGA
jgi:uncharacterized membrane protein (DUF485 family)